MPNQSLCMSCRYGSSCADYIADQDTFVVRCDKYQKLITNADNVRSMTDEDLAYLLYTAEEHIFNGNLWNYEQWQAWLKSPAEEVKDHA